jgi:hypothetical protein
MPDEDKKKTSDKNFAYSGAWSAIGSGMGVALGADGNKVELWQPQS